MVPLHDDVPYPDDHFEGYIPVDGEVFKLGSGPNAPIVEFLNTDGRVGLRIHNRFGAGVFLTEFHMSNLQTLITNIVEKKSNDNV